MSILVAYVWVIKAQTRMKMNIKFCRNLFHEYDTLYEWWVQGIKMYSTFFFFVYRLTTHKFEWIKWRQYLPPLIQEFSLLFDIFIVKIVANKSKLKDWIAVVWKHENNWTNPIDFYPLFLFDRAITFLALTLILCRWYFSVYW